MLGRPSDESVIVSGAVGVEGHCVPVVDELFAEAVGEFGMFGDQAEEGVDIGVLSWVGADPDAGVVILFAIDDDGHEFLEKEGVERSHPSQPRLRRLLGFSK